MSNAFTNHGILRQIVEAGWQNFAMGLAFNELENRRII
jgi:hypothetical protein